VRTIGAFAGTARKKTRARRALAYKRWRGQGGGAIGGPMSGKRGSIAGDGVW
jgi:hypothetical protein